MPIEAATSAIGAQRDLISRTPSEWSVGSVVDGVESRATGSQSAFGGVLGSQLQKLEATQNQAAEAARSLATGTATDPSSAVVAIDRARLAMQLASVVRTKGVEAFQDLMRTQI